MLLTAHRNVKVTSDEKHVIVIDELQSALRLYILFTHQQIHFLLNLEKFKFTLEYT